MNDMMLESAAWALLHAVGQSDWSVESATDLVATFCPVVCHPWPGGCDLHYDRLFITEQQIRAGVKLHDWALELLDEMGSEIAPGIFNAVRAQCGCGPATIVGPLGTIAAKDALQELRALLVAALAERTSAPPHRGGASGEE